MSSLLSLHHVPTVLRLIIGFSPDAVTWRHHAKPSLPYIGGEHDGGEPIRANSHIQFPAQSVRDPLRPSYLLRVLETNGILPPVRSFVGGELPRRSGAKLVPAGTAVSAAAIPNLFRHHGTLLVIAY